MKQEGKSLKVTSPGVTFIRDKGNTSGQYKLGREEIVQDEVKPPSVPRKTMGMDVPPKSGKFPRW